MSLTYPPVGFYFSVAFDLPGMSQTDIRFSDVGGLSMELEQETVSEGGENRFSHKLPLRASYPDLILKRGLVSDSKLREWCRKAIQDFDIAPITVWLNLLNEEGEPLKSYSFINAWPKKWSCSDYNAQASEVVVETLELSYQYFRES